MKAGWWSVEVKHFLQIAFLVICLNVLPSAATAKIPFLPDDSIEEIREKIAINGYDFKVKENWITRLPPDERARLRGRYYSPPSKLQLQALDSGPLPSPGGVVLPEAFDWRDYNGHSYIGPIRDQGSCGSCYAFGACAAAEGTYNWALGLYDSACIDFSEAFLAFCLDGEYGGFSGCSGSSYDYEELDALVEQGICEESVYPYNAVDNGCLAGSESAPRALFSNWYRVPCGDIEAIKTAIITYGVVDAAVNVDSAFDYYAGDIYENDETDCDTSPCYYATTNHCIALVGWNDNGGNGYWILRNSWGTGWGEDGYMKIAYDAAHVSCAVCYLVYEGGSIDDTGRISGSAWHDADQNGVRDAGEPGLPGWKVFLDGNSNYEIDEGENVVITDSDGNYSFTDLDPGVYVVAQEMQDGWNQSSPEVAAGDSATESRFLEIMAQNSDPGELVLMVADSPPTPPAGYERQIVYARTGSDVILDNVPTSTWTYGCSATSAGMMFGYYDRTGYSNMYTGSTNSGVAPMTDLGQGANPSSPIVGSCSLIASMAGFDGRPADEPAHVDDYWIAYGSSGPDPWVGVRSEHDWSDCVADCLGTNQWKWDFNGDSAIDSNTDGGTIYFSYSSASPLVETPGDFWATYWNPNWGETVTTLGRGLRLFAESRGYTVELNYNQKVDSVYAGGFSFVDFMNEIDHGYPVLIHVTGHTMLGVGYEESSQTIYIHDTWDNYVHSMPWGGAYAGMTHQAVTVFHLSPSEESIPGIHQVTIVSGSNETGVDFGNYGPDLNDSVRIERNGATYNVLQAAFDLCLDEDNVQAQVNGYESVVLDHSKTLTFTGGYSGGFAEQVGVSKIFGSLTIESGSLTVDRLVIQ